MSTTEENGLTAHLLPVGQQTHKQPEKLTWEQKKNDYMREYMRKRYQENKERERELQKERQKKYYKTHKDEINERMKYHNEKYKLKRAEKKLQILQEKIVSLKTPTI
jgi:exonuclease VII large subunit